MKFSEIKYQRPDLAALKHDVQRLIDEFEASTTPEAALDALQEVNRLRMDFQTMFELAYIRNSLDTRDEFYRAEKAFFDEASPEMEALETRLRRALIASPHRKALEERLGGQWFRLAEVQTRSFGDEIVEDMQQVNARVTDYNQLVASARIPFGGETYNLSQMGKFTESPDRETRQNAVRAMFGFFAEHGDAFDEMYDDLVRMRTAMAQKLGYENFVQMGYDRMNRTDYGPQETAAFREAIRKHIVPLAAEIRDKQRERLGLSSLRIYDTNLWYRDGNAKPKGDPNFILENGRRMYKELSLETDAFFQYMLDSELMDLLSREGKRVGGYCTFIPNLKAPFIFANFNGTLGDVTVLTHEAGHAFQAYQSRNMKLPEYFFPTSEAAEIDSMSMEFFTWKWMPLFFQEDADKFFYTHLADSVVSIAYMAAVDEFQHAVYERPEMTPADRKAKWRELERIYMNRGDEFYEGMPYLEEGGLWQRQLHIYNYPFYYIDYALAQVCALQYFLWMQENSAEAWESYLRLCGLGGSRSFLELVSEAGLRSPFEESTLADVVPRIRDVLRHLEAKLPS
ncbi:M3 family oligoendopeptidase [Alicyclobacillus mali (ex Roth et al. 2021)]|uniref:M3 family oligoendopeptidase n=1 Tax=Alicyclobacillus mali (ex Roth et al. 2021) TaxID=1123961 RepID=UPI0008319159|nr:M3 family oligoendopeptidase [Alicyclobacillus mali (ex Roth et al. 2021)]